MAREPLLDLSTLIENRPTIRVDGETYHLKSPEELSLADSQRFTSWGNELDALSAAGADKTAALEALVGVVARAALVDMPAVVFERLSGGQRLSVIQVFTGLLLGRRLQLAGAMVAQMNSPTGEKSSLASSTPSAATSTAGLPASPQLS